MKYLPICAILLMTGGFLAAADSEPSGATVYAQNCTRCHQAPDPAQRNAQAWRPVALHMRVFADLTRREEQAVLAFLAGTPARTP